MAPESHCKLMMPAEGLLQGSWRPSEPQKNSLVASWSHFGSFSHNVHWIFNDFYENVRGNRERKAETELGQFTSCLVCCSHHCPTCRGGLSNANTMRVQINLTFWCDFGSHFDAIGLKLACIWLPNWSQMGRKTDENPTWFGDGLRRWSWIDLGAFFDRF